MSELSSFIICSQNMPTDTRIHQKSTKTCCRINRLMFESIVFFFWNYSLALFTHTRTHTITASIHCNAYLSLSAETYHHLLEVAYFGERDCEVLLDTGSQLTLISRDTKHHHGPLRRHMRGDQIISEALAKVANNKGPETYQAVISLVAKHII